MLPGLIDLFPYRIVLRLSHFGHLILRLLLGPFSNKVSIIQFVNPIISTSLIITTTYAIFTNRVSIRLPL